MSQFLSGTVRSVFNNLSSRRLHCSTSIDGRRGGEVIMCLINVVLKQISVLFSSNPTELET